MVVTLRPGAVYRSDENIDRRCEAEECATLLSQQKGAEFFIVDKEVWIGEKKEIWHVVQRDISLWKPFEEVAQGLRNK
ncbi:hypothetical protein KKA47_05445 [bacterium]|nr:hypothetical protein [bacterium]